jgi:hypothetical protein
MDIMQFFQHSAGKWFSQRTSQNLTGEQSVAGSSDLWIDALDRDDPQVIALCEQYRVDPTLAVCGLQVRWEGMPVLHEKKQSGSTVLVALGEGDAPKSGQLLHGIGATQSPPLPGRYAIGSDEALTLIVETDRLYAEERLWFASENLRLRTSIVREADGNHSACFCSEIRMGGVKPPAESGEAAQSRA